MSTNNLLIAPLNWGLGHATRCIPIIKTLEKSGFTPIIASDGVALALLKKEFPHLTFIALPAYNIVYAEKGNNFKWKLLAQLPKMFRAINKERAFVQQIIKDHNIVGIISDNRLGVYSKTVPSVFITHQLNVLSGKTSWFTSKVHAFYIAKFVQCWVPDIEGKPNLSGKLGHLKRPLKKTAYIGPLSRFVKKEAKIVYQLMVILSGPEPQRTLLEKKLIEELQTYPNSVLFVKGIIEEEQKTWTEKQVTYYNFMRSDQLNDAFNSSGLIVCRSGYTTVMDLAKLRKKAFFIPTPGQYEQEYLAKKYKKEGIAPSCKQEKFNVLKLSNLNQYTGLPFVEQEINWEKLFEVFKN